MDQKKVWTPKEIKQPETIVFHMPVIRRPITTRMIMYFIPSLMISILILFALIGFKQIRLQLVMFCIMFPFLSTLLLNAPRNGVYIEDIIKKKIKYKTKARIMLNEKAVKSRRK